MSWRANPPNRDVEEITFRIRDTARARVRRTPTPIPAEVVVHADGSAVVTCDAGNTLLRYETIVECLATHELLATDLEPVD